jgi:hypothetical protein
MTTHESGTRALLRQLATGDPNDHLSFDTLLDNFRQRAFGVLLLLVTLPTFIPLPVGVGSVSGTLVALVGVQIAVLMAHPWMPGFMRRRSVRRGTLLHFEQRFERVLRWVERYSRPRLEALCDRGIASTFTGVLLILIGLLLALPIPFTNYPLGFLLLLYSIALIERDGALLLVAWIAGGSTILASVLLSGNIVQLLQHWLQ